MHYPCRLQIPLIFPRESPISGLIVPQIYHRFRNFTAESIPIKESVLVYNTNRLSLFAGVFSIPPSLPVLPYIASLPYMFSAHCTFGGCTHWEYGHAGTELPTPHFPQGLSGQRGTGQR